MKKILYVLFTLVTSQIVSAQNNDNVALVLKKDSTSHLSYYVNNQGKRIGPSFPLGYITGVYKSNIENNLYSIVKNGKWGLINNKGEVIIDCQGDYRLTVNSLDFITLSKNKKFGGYDKSGKKIIPTIYDEMQVSEHFYCYPKEYVLCKKNGKWGCVKIKTGKEVIPCIYKYLETWGMSYECIPFCNEYEKWGLLNLKGEVIVAPKFDYIDTYSDKAKVVIAELNQKYGIFDLKGNIVLPFEFEKWAYNRMNGDPFEYGTQVFFKDKQIYVVNEKGNILKQDSYDKIDGGSWWYVDNGLIRVYKNGKQGLILVNGKVILPCIYDEVNNEGKGKYKNFFRVNKNGNYGYVDSSGKMVIDCNYNKDEVAKRLEMFNYADYKRPRQKLLDSDIDIIPQISEKENENTFAVIIANEHYRREVAVDYAINDGLLFKKYCENLLGVPESNIHFVEDATLNDFHAELDWINNIAKAYQGDAKVFFYYAGHGIPDEKSGSAYMLPTDGMGNNIMTGYSLNHLYDILGSLNVKHVIAFLDACFSGSKRGEGMLTSTRGVVIKAKSEIPKGKVVVFSAAKSDETAYPYEENKHGLFTYFLLKKLKESTGHCTLGELSDYVTTQVMRCSIVTNGKIQTPTVTPSTNMIESWKGLNINK